MVTIYLFNVVGMTTERQKNGAAQGGGVLKAAPF